MRKLNATYATSKKLIKATEEDIRVFKEVDESIKEIEDKERNLRSSERYLDHKLLKELFLEKARIPGRRKV